MKGVILAGGLGTRLRPLTKIANKHLLPVYDRPMIYFPIETLCRAGIRDIMIVTGGNSAGDFLRLLGNGRQFGLDDIAYTYQEGEGGIAEALGLCEHFADGDRIVVMLGDNILQDDITPYVRAFDEQRSGARVLLKQVHDPERFGVAELSGDRILRIVEKPAIPRSNYAVIGVYMYDRRVFDYIKQLEPSPRGELEITDVNNAYIREDALYYDVVDGWWSDAGTIEGLHRTSRLVAARQTKIFDVQWEALSNGKPTPVVIPNGVSEAAVIPNGASEAAVIPNGVSEAVVIPSGVSEAVVIPSGVSEANRVEGPA